ncbi:GIY-YIG nuclease family protein [Niabella ginsengisoli]|uniref:GIY-YIG nuclease family protein n=1 Tax=Niabella ginsengisoli TaxID=522298 RepID=A0ABS9SR35_9BACT|nr:GIY-YIG nuclease family protein [Niabella ginsengisoli]MCH5600853.1 GIY-YIG nuclease family protein [Niabella ginsengisoli]
MFYVYILFSLTADKYYIGFTGGLLEERLRKHNTYHKGFTGKTNDWTIVFFETFTDRSSAMKREKEIKAKKAGIYRKVDSCV